MNFLYYVSSRKHLKTNIKILNKKNKGIICISYITLSFFFMLPYISLKKLIILTFCIEFVVFLITKSFYLEKITKTTKNILILILSTSITNYLIDYKYYNKKNLIFSDVSLTYFCQVIIINTNQQFKLLFLLHRIVYKIVVYLMNVAIVRIVYIILLQTLSIMIRNELINQSLLLIYIQTKSTKLVKNSLNLLVGPQVLESIIECIQNFYLSMKIKEIFKISKVLHEILLSTHIVLNQLLQYQNDLNIVLWMRGAQRKLYKKLYI
uniref:Transmembrane protein n=1 Tax=Polysiphonia sp. TaxID=1967842 RepID=A0A1Z1MTV7_9FLOR|nr:hypothetical protein [Polysiphonia sp.]